MIIENEKFYTSLAELLKIHRAAIITVDISGDDNKGYYSVGFQFGVKNEVTDRCHVTSSDIYDLINRNAKGR